MFIQLTDSEWGEPLYLNTAYIQAVYLEREDNGTTYTRVEMVGDADGHAFHVAESVSKVMGMLP